MASTEGISEDALKQLLEIISEWYDDQGYTSMLKVLYRDHLKNTPRLRKASGTMDLMNLLIASGNLHSKDLTLLYDTIKVTDTLGLEIEIKHLIPSCPNFRDITISKITPHRQKVMKLGMALIDGDIVKISRLYNKTAKNYTDAWTLIMDLEHRSIIYEGKMEEFIENLRKNGLVQAVNALTSEVCVKLTLKRKRDASGYEDQPNPKYVIDLLKEVCEYKRTLPIRDIPECSALIRKLDRFYTSISLTLDEIEEGSIVFHLFAQDSSALENLLKMHLSSKLIKNLAEILVPEKHLKEFLDEWMTHIDETEYNTALIKLKDTEKVSTSKTFKSTSKQLSRDRDVKHSVGSGHGEFK
ncbi:uncharacterized protein LOC117123727 [Anneissia japonica]|uniref:uncharacterized protein LOC117123727 n=1 Tax=Anneissia japonica TaxID=1529436 RepID=UPI001425AB76|nr:uncharacterized protein LOC117123727 [Anneissia japonica]